MWPQSRQPEQRFRSASRADFPRGGHGAPQDQSVTNRQRGIWVSMGGLSAFPTLTHFLVMMPQFLLYELESSFSSRRQSAQSMTR